MDGTESTVFASNSIRGEVLVKRKGMRLALAVVAVVGTISLAACGGSSATSGGSSGTGSQSYQGMARNGWTEQEFHDYPSISHLTLCQTSALMGFAKYPEAIALTKVGSLPPTTTPAMKNALEQKYGSSEGDQMYEDLLSAEENAGNCT